MVCEPTNENAKRAHQRYTRDAAIAGALYLAAVFGAVSAIRYFDLPHWALVVLALLPLAPALLMLRAYLVFTRSMDEFQRRIQSEALLIASAVVVFGSFAYGFLEEWADFPHVPLIWVFPAFCGVWGVATFIVRRRYK